MPASRPNKPVASPSSKQLPTVEWGAACLEPRYWRMTKRGIIQPKVIVAMARELVGYLWAALHPDAQPTQPGSSSELKQVSNPSQSPQPPVMVAPARS